MHICVSLVLFKFGKVFCCGCCFVLFKELYRWNFIHLYPKWKDYTQNRSQFGKWEHREIIGMLESLVVHRRDGLCAQRGRRDFTHGRGCVAWTMWGAVHELFLENQTSALGTFSVGSHGCVMRWGGCWRDGSWRAISASPWSKQLPCLLKGSMGKGRGVGKGSSEWCLKPRPVRMGVMSGWRGEKKVLGSYGSFFWDIADL